MSEITALVSTALKPTLDEVLAEFEHSHRHAVTLTYAPSAQIDKRVAAGEPCDVIIVTGPQCDHLIAVGAIVVHSRRDLASSVIGLAVRQGANTPDVSTTEGFKRTLLGAQSIAMSNPDGGGASGAHLALIFAKLGIAEALAPRLIYGPGGPNGLIATFIQNGQAELGLQQIPELMAVPGIEIIGPLPAELQMETIYSAGLATDAIQPAAATKLIAFLAGPRVAAVLTRKGMNAIRGRTDSG